MKKKKEEGVVIKKEKNPRSKKASVIITCSICAGACALGVGGGLLLNHFLSYNGIDYSNLNTDDYEADVTKLMAKYHDTKPSNYLSTFKSHELVNIATAKVSEHNHVKSIGKGLVVAAMNVKQIIRSYYQKAGDTYFFENISNSKVVSVNKRFYQQNDEVALYLGDKKNEESATWNNEAKETLNLVDFETKWGRNFQRSSILIISERTTYEDQSSVTQDGDYIKVSLELDPMTSVIRYVKQMVATSDLDAPPVFHKMHVDYVLDKDLNLISSKTDELYDVKSFGITSKNTKGCLEETLIYDAIEERPSLTTDCNYSL